MEVPLTAQTWPALVAAVKHAETCGSQSAAIDADGRVVNLGLACNCDRDARIARGIEAAMRTAQETVCFGGRQGHDRWPCPKCDAAVLAAFRKGAT